jgi:hypothetical protein
MPDEGRSKQNDRKAVTQADHARMLRVYLPKLVLTMLEEISAPGYTGSFELKLSSKDGRPGEPEHSVRRYGIDEERFFGTK